MLFIKVKKLKSCSGGQDSALISRSWVPLSPSMLTSIAKLFSDGNALIKPPQTRLFNWSTNYQRGWIRMTEIGNKTSTALLPTPPTRLSFRNSITNEIIICVVFWCSENQILSLLLECWPCTNLNNIRCLFFFHIRISMFWVNDSF